MTPTPPEREELWGRYLELRRLSRADQAKLADAQMRALRAEAELEDLKGDVFLYGIGEITREQLLGLVEGAGRAEGAPR